MEMAAKPVPSTKRATVSAAKLAYFEGDFERCLQICSEIRVRPVATASEVALLSARAYLRTGRAAEAQAAITETLATHASLDAALTAQMLLGTARIRQGDPDGGIALLEAAAARAVDAHFAVRSEIAFSTALGFWAKRDIDRAESFLTRVDRRSDIIHARALELTAWCQMARGHYRRCADYFVLTLLRLDSCRAHDRAIVATAISTLSILAAELFDREIARVAQHRARTMEWTSGLGMQHYLTLLHQALFCEIDGDTTLAYEYAMQARAIAPTVPFEAFAWSVSAGIARNSGERYVSTAYARRAMQILATLELRELSGEERFSILAVAESCANFDDEHANRLLAAYWGLAPADKMVALIGDRRLAAEESLVAATVAEAHGDLADARCCYRRAFEIFKQVGYVRRALMAAVALVKLNVPESEDLRAYIRLESGSTANFITRYLAVAAVDQPLGAAEHPIVATLPPAQREVVRLICQGKSNREIALLRRVGEQTIKNMLTKHVFRAFGVSSRAALVSTCLRRA